VNFNTFNVERHLTSSQTDRKLRAGAMKNVTEGTLAL
jgi:hypothetical protein